MPCLNRIARVKIAKDRKLNHVLNFMSEKTQIIIFLIIILLVVVVAVYYFRESENNQPNGQANKQAAKDQLAESQATGSQPDDNQTLTVSEMNQQKNSAASADNSVVETNSLDIKTLREGTGESAKAGDELEVHYTGTLKDGTKFDSSRDRGVPFNFTLGAGQVIRGWDYGMIGMKVGEIRKLTIPAELGYGSADMGTIPPNSTLIFEVELLKIN